MGLIWSPPLSWRFFSGQKPPESEDKREDSAYRIGGTTTYVQRKFIKFWCDFGGGYLTLLVPHILHPFEHIYLQITPHRAKSIGILLESDSHIISLLSPRKLVCFSFFKLLSRGWHLLPYILSINVSSLQCHLLVYIPQLVVMTVGTFISNCNLVHICKIIIW